MKKFVLLLCFILSIQSYALKYDPSEVKINLSSLVSVSDASCKIKHHLSNVTI